VVEGKPILTNVRKKFVDCLDAPNYTVFSNTTSAAEWNENLAPATPPVVPLESPHNSIHLAVGGCDIPAFDRSPIEGANGDMGENDTAGLDPIFHFHHCFIDRMFWLWQKRRGFTDHLEVIAGYPGTNSVDSQGPTPGTPPNAWLSLDSPLDPFRIGSGRTKRPYTSLDCINIERQLGYTYGPGSLEGNAAAAAVLQETGGGTVRVSGINRARIRGSFMISAFANIAGKRQHLGTEAVLSRWHVAGCANCQTHLEAKAFIPVHGLRDDVVHSHNIEVEVRTRDGLLSHSRTLPTVERIPFRFEVR
jgi:tyrosinase